MGSAVTCHRFQSGDTSPRSFWFIITSAISGRPGSKSGDDQSKVTFKFRAIKRNHQRLTLLRIGSRNFDVAAHRLASSLDPAAMPLLEVTDLRTYFHTRSGVYRAVDGIGRMHSRC